MVRLVKKWKRDDTRPAAKDDLPKGTIWMR